jgi:UDP-N-acetylglucosamine transferase subunit ALG13
MIFVTVGTDLPFDRLVRVIDDWAGSTGRQDVFAQIGATRWTPAHLQYSHFLPPDEFTQRFAEARVIVAHAGMGTILSALRWEKPILVMPRRASLGEQRNEHQLATARRLSTIGKVDVAMDESELRQRLQALDQLKAREAIGPHASAQLIDAIGRFIAEGRATPMRVAADEPSGASHSGTGGR